MLLRTSRIRAFVRDDIPEVADLWLRSFRGSETPASTDIRSYFEEIFFNHPWPDASLPSLVYESEQHCIVGFLGLLPRPMVFHGQPLRVAVATQLMVDRRHRGFVALELMRRFFAGSQDLSFSDGANESARLIWERCGGQTARLYCFEWTRSLRPAESIALRSQTRGSFKTIARMGRPLARSLDAIAFRVPSSPYYVPTSGATVDDAISIEDLLACIAGSAQRRALHPQYDPESLSWVLRQAGQANSLGSLRTALIRDHRGAVAGWGIYYLKPGDIAQIVQFGAEPARTRLVFNCLCAHVQRCGAVGVTGQIDPPYMQELACYRCRFYCPGLGVLVHSKNEPLLKAIHRGDAFLTRLEGEWWLRFGIDRHHDW